MIFVDQLEYPRINQINEPIAPMYDMYCDIMYNNYQVRINTYTRFSNNSIPN